MLPKPGRENEHLWVLITNPDPRTQEAIMVNVTTQRPHSDTTTILNVGDHPFIQKPSVIFYADTRTVKYRPHRRGVEERCMSSARCISRAGDSQDSVRRRRIAVDAQEDQNRIRRVCCCRSNVEHEITVIVTQANGGQHSVRSIPSTGARLRATAEHHWRTTDRTQRRTAGG